MKIVNKFYSILTLAIIVSSCSFLEKLQIPYYTPLEVEQMSQPKELQQIIQNRVKVAVLLPLSGKHQKLGKSLLNAATLSLFDNDKKNELKLVIFDSKGTPFGAKDAIKEIAKQDIKIVIGPVFSFSVEAIAQTVVENDIIVLSFSNNMDLINKKGIFLMGFSPQQQIEKIVNFAIAANKNSFSVIAPNNQYGLKISNILKETVKRKDASFITSELYIHGGSGLSRSVQRLVNSYIISERAYEDQPEDIERSEVIIAQEDKIYADVILIPESGRILSNIVAKIKKHNINERDFQIIGSSSWDKPSTLDDSNLIGGWFPALDSNLYKKFEKQYYQIYQELAVRIDSIAYDAVDVVIKLMKKNRDIKNGEVLTMEDFTEYRGWTSEGFKGIDGLFRFLPDGIVQRDLAILEVGYDHFAVIKTPSDIFLRY